MGLSKERVTKKGRRSVRFTDLQTEAWTYNGKIWKSMGIVCGGFCPLGTPVKMANGNYMMSGCNTDWMGTIAISHGDDLTKRDVVRPDTDGEVFTEAGAWADGETVFLLLRNGTLRSGDKYHAAVAQSRDFGRTFSVCELSNLPMSTTKPFCGRLDDGRPFLVFSDSIDGLPHDRALCCWA